MKPERAPSRDELLAMAYVDGELDEEARRTFERRLESEPALARELVQLRSLEVLARQAAPPEPMDHEWRRLEQELLHRGGNHLGLWSVLIAALGLAGWTVVEILRSDLTPVPKGLLLVLMGGLGLVFVLTLRARVRTLPFDPYTHVKR